MTSRTVPDATYRLQLHAGFGFDAASAELDYLAALGVSHAYCSPYLQAAAGSTHGYDGVDPRRVSDDLGGPGAHARFVATLRRVGLGQVLDIVPNHLSTTDPRNLWWWDVLRRGEASEYARHFDVEWRAGGEAFAGKVVLPILGDTLDEELAAGTIAIDRERNELVYFDVRLPLADGSAEADSIEDVIARQHYVPMFWRDGLEHLQHRRFFDVSTLVGVRVEDPAVFDDVHRTVLGWVASGDVDGLRVDHPDGLADPTGYVQRLSAEAPRAWLVVEKILEPGEQLRDDWPVDGTTGYDALNVLAGVLVDSEAELLLTETYAELVESKDDFETVARTARLEVVHTLLAPELERVTSRFSRLTGIPVPVAREVIAAFVSELPVYRTYIRPGEDVAEEDRRAIAVAMTRLREDHSSLHGGCIDALRDVLLERCPQARQGDDVHDVVRRIQQLSGPAMAKGVEDTAFYRYTRFVAANEVGGDPAHIATDVRAFHEANLRCRRRLPAAMITTSTHDTKRSEDVRARLAVLSEIAGDWTDLLRSWCARSGDWWRTNAQGVTRDVAMEVLLHQTLVGAHPLSPDRAHQYLEKAMREAKSVTSWLDPDESFESTAHGLLDHLLTDAAHQRELTELVSRVLVPGRVNALAQKLLALTVPGIPDLYQGTELWTLDLVDPDNRRPVDYELRRALLLRDATDWDALLRDPEEPGLPKLHVVRRALDLRRRRRECFLGDVADYTPIDASGEAAAHVVAFQRGGRESAVVTVVPRLPARLARDGGWRDTTVALEHGTWRDVLTGADHVGGALRLSELTERFPVVLLERM